MKYIFFSMLLLLSRTPIMIAEMANKIRAGNKNVLEAIGDKPLFLNSDNFVYRPWGGQQLASYKGVAQKFGQSATFGESFEVAAYPKNKDEEAGTYASSVQFEDGSSMPLLELLEIAGNEVLGTDFIERYGHEIPLLPKILNIKQLLSLQTHPAGNTEAYIIIDCDPGATLYLGFSQSVDTLELKQQFAKARALQLSFLSCVLQEADQDQLYRILQPFFAGQNIGADDIIRSIHSLLKSEIDTDVVAGQLEQLRGYYQQFLRLMNCIAVKPGDVIYNATPQRLLGPGELPSAEVHALGNPENKEILALEVRRPGKTFRLWDNVRFPLRPIAIDEALETLNCQATNPEDFFIEQQPTPDPGVNRLIESETFVVDQVKVQAGSGLQVPSARIFHILHLMRGPMQLCMGPDSYNVDPGQTIIIPAGCNYQLVAEKGDAEIIKLSIPI